MKPVKVKVNDKFDRSKLSLTQRDWIQKDNSDHPRNGIMYKGETYEVDASDHIVKHFLDGGDLVRVDSEEKKTDSEKLQELPYINEERAEEILEENKTFEEFKEREDLIDYLSSLKGIGHSRAEKISEEVTE